MKANLELHSGFKTSPLPFLLIICALPGAVTSQAQSTYEPYLFATLAGHANAGSAAQFNNPESVAVDSAGKVYVADTSNKTIRVSGVTLTTSASPSAGGTVSVRARMGAGQASR
jgi:DNA-binding beta-propeller fold protein YncE